jgi:hypothetical protein
MPRILQIANPVQPLVAVSFNDFKVDPEQLAADKIAERFALPISIAMVVARLAGLGHREAA